MSAKGQKRTHSQLIRIRICRASRRIGADVYGLAATFQNRPSRRAGLSLSTPLALRSKRGTAAKRISVFGGSPLAQKSRAEKDINLGLSALTQKEGI
jgi:hypothetical protein